MAVRSPLAAVLLLLTPMLALAQSPSRRPTSNRELNQLLHDLQKILDKQEAVREEIADLIRQIPRGKPYPRLTAPQMATMNCGETQSVTIRIDWRLYKESQLTIKVEKSPANADIEVPAEIELDEEKHGERFEFPVKAGRKPGVFMLILTPARGEPVEFKVLVK